MKTLGMLAIAIATVALGFGSSGCLLLLAGAIEASKTSTPAPPSPPPEPPSPPPPPEETVRVTPARDKDAVPFDRKAAATSLSQVAENIQWCKTDGGPSGSGHVTITFAPNGNVQSALTDQPPFADTPTGACIAGKFSEARIPPFTGAPVKVGKSFSIE